FEVTSQQAARWPLSSGGGIVVIDPSRARAYDAAPLGPPTPASETSRVPLWSKSNPNGGAPGVGADGWRSERSPSLSTRKVSMRFELRPVTTSTSPFGEKRTCPASVAPACSKRVEPAIGVSPSLSSVNPLTVARAALFLFRT